MEKRHCFAPLFTTVLFALVSCAAPSKERSTNTDSTRESWPKRVIDAHLHLNFSNKMSDDVGFVDSQEEFLKQLKEVNGVGAVCHEERRQKKAPDYKSLNIVPCMGLTKDPDLKKVEAGLRNQTHRCVKIYLGYEYQWANHPKYMAVYKLAEKYQVPVVFHTGDTYDPDGGLKYADPLTIDEVAVKFRKVKFVMAHVGNPWIESAAEVAYKNENVYIDVSALLIGKLKEEPEEKVNEFVVKPIRWAWGYVENPKKLMFGTDWPLVRIKDYVEIAKRAVPEADWDRFFYQNAADVFGFEKIYPNVAGK